MPGYRTIPSKDTFSIDEKLGGIITIKQLVYLIITFLLTYATMIISKDFFADETDTIYAWGTVLFLCLVFIFGNFDRVIIKRLKYYFGDDKKRLQANPKLLANVRAIEENKVITLDGRVLAILKIQPINFMLLSDEAQEAKISSFETYLRQLVYPISHHVQSENVDLTDYFAQITNNASKIKNNQLTEYFQLHKEFLEKYLKEKNSKTKNHYVVIQVKDERYAYEAKTLEPNFLKNIYLKLNSLLKEFNPVFIFFGGKNFEYFYNNNFKYNNNKFCCVSILCNNNIHTDSEDRKTSRRNVNKN
jgi:hypothetical protein